MYEMSYLSLSVLLLCLEIWSSLLHSQKFPIDCDPQSMLEGTVMGLVKNFEANNFHGKFRDCFLYEVYLCMNESVSFTLNF